MNWTSLPHLAATIPEPALNLLVLVLAYRVGLSRRFPAMIAYLVLRLVSSVSLMGVLDAGRLAGMTAQGQAHIYFYGFWTTYVASAIAIYFVIQQIFRELMRPVPDLGRLGMVAFRWVSIVSVLITLAAVALPALNGNFSFASTTVDLMRSISIMALCLLAFLGLTVRLMGLSFRSPLFGMGLGFALQAVLDTVLPALLFHHQPAGAIEQLVMQIGPMAALIVWMGYFLVPRMEAELSAVALPVSSPLIRWNEIAKALGHNAPHVAVGQSQAFFLQDVEGVVDKVLTKNSISVNN